MTYHATSFTADHVRIARLNEPDQNTGANAQISVADNVTMFVDTVADCDVLIAVLLQAREHLALHEVVDAEIVEEEPEHAVEEWCKEPGCLRLPSLAAANGYCSYHQLTAEVA